MKRRITLIVTAVLLMMTSFVWAQTRTQINWVASEQGYTNGQAIESVVFDDNVSATFDKGSNNNAPKYYNTGAAIRCYGGNYFTMTTTEGNLTEVVITFASGEGTNAITTDVGTYDNGTWTGSATAVTFTIGGTSGHRRLAAFSITYSTGGVQTVATPTFTPAAGTYFEAQNVTINCATDNATIYYTVDGTDPTTSSAIYSTPIAVSETTTIKAMGVKADMNNSAIASATYTIQTGPSVITIAEAKALELNEYALVQGIVTFIDGRNVYIQDETAGIDLYLNANAPSTLALGDKVQAYGKRAVYKGLIELSGINGDDSSQFSVISTGNTLPLAVKTIAEINSDFAGANALQSTRVKIVDATIGAINISNNTPITQGDNSLNIYKMPAVEGLLEDDIVTVIGVLGCYNTIQLRIASAADVTYSHPQVETVATPTFTPAEGIYNEAQDVTIACETEGATIRYTVDSTDPTETSAVYTAAISVSETTTIKAMAMKAGMNNSNIASATYTLEMGPAIITIAEARALANNEYAYVQGVVTFIDGRNVYIQDATAGIDLFLNNNTVPTALAVGDMVLAYGKKTVYNGLVELKDINGSDEAQFSIISNGNPLPLAVKTIAEILADHNGDKMLQSTRLQIVEATIGAINNNGNTPITQDGNTLNLYKMPVVEGLEENDYVTVTGVLGCYNAPQLRISSASDVVFTHPDYPTLVANPTTVTGFSYQEGNGPSDIRSFALSASNLTGPAYVYPSEYFEISSASGIYFTPENTIVIAGAGTFNNIHVYVRLKAGLEIGTYSSVITMSSAGAQTIAVEVTGNVVEPVQPSNYTRISDISQLNNGSKVVFAARFDDNANDYYAMTAQTSGKPAGVLFTSATSDYGETLPTTIADADSVYYWDVTVENGFFTFTNAAGEMLGYASGTNFATGGDNVAWTIEYGTSAPESMVPEYGGYVITNGNSTGRAFAINSNYHSYGAYSKSNMTGSNAAGYNFYIDMFATEGSGVLTCATPTFNPEAGTYFEAQSVEIDCSTADATIYYTIDGSDPTENSTVYTEAITVAESMTIKAIAMKEGYENSSIATAEYTVILGAVTIFSQDWEGDMNGWTFVTVEGNKPWTIGQYQGNHYANANGYNGGVNEQWCISPAFSLNVYSNTTLTFRNAKNYNGPDMQLFFSNDYNGETPSTATWTELTYEKSTGSYAWTESGIIDLANFSGDNCYIGFKYTSTETEAAAWEVDDIVLMGFTTEPYLNVTPNALSGFTHHIGEGPSASQTFVLTAGNITPAPGGTTGSINVSVYSPFEISLDNEEYDDEIFFEDVTNLEATTIYVRMNGTEIGQYTETVNIYASSGNEATVTLSGTVTDQPTPGDDWNRIYALSDLNNGDLVILASRYDATVGDGYYAMTAGVSGKPDGVLFTSVNEGGAEKLPAEIADDAETYLWTVTVDGDVITLTNAAGDMLGYNSSTNFAGNENTDWNIALETSSENALIPNYTGFVITNATTTNRGIAKNASNKFGAYATSNINNTDYNFYLDIFVQGGVVTPTVATPVFSMASGTYYETIEVEITCATEGATIYYTTDGSDPTTASTVYTAAITVDEDMTLKAIAMKEGYENSNIATANYVILSNVVIIFEQDWEGDMNDWTFVTVEGNKPWSVATYNNNHYAYANGYNDDTDNEQWCISPAFNLTQYAGQNVMLTFMNAKNYSGPDLELFFTNDYDGQDPTAADWQPLTFNMSTGGYNWAESGNISLNAFSGAICYIGFRYISTLDDGAAAWEVDDIMLIADMGNDPYLSVTPNVLNGFTHTVGYGPSEAQTFVLTGGNLPPMPGSTVSGITISCDNSAYELSVDGLDYYPYLGIIADDGTLEPTLIYVRLNGEEVGDYIGTITIEDEVTATVSVSGYVTEDGIGENFASSVNVWNNVNELMIVTNGDETLNIVVYNIVGQPVLSEAVSFGQTVIRHNLAEGVYIVRVANSKEMTGVKVVVKR